MPAELRDAYRTAAWRVGGIAVPVGDASERSLADDADIPLFADDGGHPTVTGTYLAGPMFYRVLTHRSRGGLDATAPRLADVFTTVRAEAAYASVPVLRPPRSRGRRTTPLARSPSRDACPLQKAAAFG